MKRRKVKIPMSKSCEPRRKRVDHTLIKQAGELVPLGSGLRVVGDGPYVYFKVRRADGSTTAYCFRTREEVEAAMAEGVAHDTPLGAIGRA